mmetsp:Transcript_711/g.1999  ORF Transcript_711/g.1999 Transcript_711/m.1999 type:complete len:242 (+) Transcript_711:3-728(+)
MELSIAAVTDPVGRSWSPPTVRMTSETRLRTFLSLDELGDWMVLLRTVWKARHLFASHSSTISVGVATLSTHSVRAKMASSRLVALDTISNRANTPTTPPTPQPPAALLAVVDFLDSSAGRATGSAACFTFASLEVISSLAAVLSPASSSSAPAITGSSSLVSSATSSLLLLRLIGLLSSGGVEGQVRDSLSAAAAPFAADSFSPKSPSFRFCNNRRKASTSSATSYGRPSSNICSMASSI